MPPRAYPKSWELVEDAELLRWAQAHFRPVTVRDLASRKAPSNVGAVLLAGAAAAAVVGVAWWWWSARKPRQVLEPSGLDVLGAELAAA